MVNIGTKRANNLTTAITEDGGSISGKTMATGPENNVPVHLVALKENHATKALSECKGLFFCQEITKVSREGYDAWRTTSRFGIH